VVSGLFNNLPTRLVYILLLCWQVPLIAADNYRPSTTPLKVLLPPRDEDVIHKIPDQFKNQFIYIKELTHSVLKASGQPYEISTSNANISTTEHMTLAVKQGKLSVTILNTDTHWAKRLRAIRYPVYKGLIGWRLFLIRPEMQKQFSQIRTIDELKAMIAGQGYHWPDTAILEENGLKLRKAIDYTALINLLSNEYIDYFPRGLFEIAAERPVLARAGTGLVVEQHLALHYPAAVQFYTAKENEALALAFEKGFSVINQNGQWNKLFEEHFADVIATANLANRRVFRLERSHTPDCLKIDELGVWYDPQPTSSPLLQTQVHSSRAE